ncbi:MAG: hypothetical protein D3911_05565 [Candidatus Electrothrix sp. AW3_4]|nr:hypothetical protein [Candidatus Electrothrix gigas]
MFYWLELNKGKGLKKMKNNRWNILWSCCLYIIAVLALPGQSDARVQLGQSCSLTGATQLTGQELHKGAQAYFNAHAGNAIKLLVKDDGYEPDRCLENTEQFLKNGVDALFGYFGTPTSKVAVPLATEHKVVFFAPFTGASFLSDFKTNPYSFVLRASYATEVENMIRHLKEDLDITRIGLFVQRDAFGMAGVRGAVQAQKKIKGITIIPPIPELPDEQSSMDQWNKFWKSVPNYRRNTVAVGGAVRQIRGQAVEAVILIGGSRPSALAINQWHKIHFNVPMLNISFVGSKSLASRLQKTDNVYISQVVPNPWDSSIPLIKQYQQDMNGSKYSFSSLEGYLDAKVFHHALSRVQGKLTGQTLKDAIESITRYDAGGVEISFGKDDHRGMDSVYLTKIERSGKDITFPTVTALSPLSVEE